MLQGHTTAIVPCGNPTPKKLPTGGGEWPTFRTARTAHGTPPIWIVVCSQEGIIYRVCTIYLPLHRIMLLLICAWEGAM